MKIAKIFFKFAISFAHDNKMAYICDSNKNFVTFDPELKISKGIFARKKSSAFICSFMRGAKKNCDE